MRKDILFFRERHPEFTKLFLYFCIGISAAMIDLLVFFVLFNSFDIDKFVATSISTTVAVVYAFALNVRYNFKVTTHLLKRFVSYFSVNLVGLGISFLFLYYFSTLQGHNPNLVKTLSLPAIFIVQFLLNRLVTFHKNFFHKKTV